MRILILGQKGQVARSLVEAAISRRLAARAFGRAEFDISDRASIDGAIGLFNPDMLVNAAAFSAVEEAELKPETAFSVNRDGARQAAQAAHAAGIPIIHISTDYVFDGQKQTPYRENDFTAPVNVYGLSKLEGEYAVAEASSDYLILRTAWVYSPFGNNFVTTMLRLAERGTVRVVEDQIGCPTYAADLAEAILDLSAAWSNVSPKGTFHLAAAGEASWFAFAQQIFELSAVRGGPAATVQPIKTAEYPTIARRPMNSRLDCTRLRNATGITLPHWRDALERCIEKLLANKSRNAIK